MAKRARVALNVLVKEETRAELRRIAEYEEVSQGEAVDRAVEAYSGGRESSGGSEVSRESRAIRGAGYVPIPRTDRVNSSTFSNICSHCGAEFYLAAGRSPSSLCTECFGWGHRNQANCYKCAERDRERKVRSGDTTAGDREDVEYDL